MNVRFFAGTKAQYLSLPVPRNPLGLYFCEDTKELFWADRLLTDGTRIVPTFTDLPSREKAAEGITYFVEETRNGYVLSPDRTDWVQVIYAPATESSVKAISFAGIELEEVDGVFTIDRRCAREALGFKVPEGMEDEEFEIASTDYVAKAISAIEIPEVPTKVSELENDNGFITISDVEAKDYATEQYVTDAIAAINPAVEEVKTKLETEVLPIIPTVQETIIPTVQKVETEILPTVQKVETEVIPVVQELAEKAATQEWVKEQGYLTEHQSLEEYAKKSDIPDTSEFITMQDVEDKNYLTEIPDGFATEEFVSKKIAEAELKDKEADLEAYYTKSEVDALIPDVSGLIKEIPAEYITESELEAKGYLTEHQSLEGYAKVSDLPSVDGLASESYVDAKVAAIEIPEVPTKVSELENDAGYTKHFILGLGGYNQGSNWELDISSAFEQFVNEDIYPHPILYITYNNDSLIYPARVRCYNGSFYTIEANVTKITTTPDFETQQQTWLQADITQPIEGKWIACCYLRKLNAASTGYVDKKIDAINIPETDLSDYYNKTETENLIAEAVESIEHPTVDLSDYTTKDYVAATAHQNKYEVLPIDGMFIQYRDGEIRLNTQRVVPTHQNVGATGNPNMYYATFRAFAPEGATQCKEGLNGNIDAEYSALATDEYGRKYTTIWAAIASYNGTSWSLFGANSNLDKYLGFYYHFEWYNEDTLIGTDKVRVILTNDACHDDLVPDAVARRIDDKIKTIDVPKTDLTGYATEEFVADEIAKISIPDVSDFITMSDVEAKNYLTEHQDISHLAEKEHIHANYAEKEHEHDQYLTEHQDLSEYAKKSDIPEDETFVVDFTAPDFTAALEAYKAGKLLLLTNAAPDVPGYAVMNYVRDDIITFTKFLMSRSGTYGVFNTYYLHSDNTWELAKEVKLNKVEANVSDEPVADLSTIRIGKEVYSIPSTEGFASIEYVDTAIAGIELPEYEKVDLTGYATEIYVDTKLAEVKVPTKVSELDNDAGYLVEHQDLSEYAKKEDLFGGSYNDLTDKPEIPSIDGLATEDYVNTAISGIEIPEAELYKVDFNTPDYAKAVEAYNNGKVLVLVNAAPDANGYAVMNYVSEKYITFTKFLTSRSEAYGSFNTYYLSPANTWEISKEVKLNKVEANAEGEVNGELTSIRIGKEIYSIPNTEGLASTEYVDNAISNIEIPEVNLTDYAKLTDIPDVSKFIKEIPAEYITEDELNAKGYITSLAGYATEDYVGQQIDAIDLSGYAKAEDIPTDYLTESDLAGYSKFSGSYNDLADKPEIPSVEGLASEEFVKSEIAAIDIPEADLTNYYTKAETAETIAVAVAEKADKVPFTTDKFVGKAIGGFAVGANVKGLTIAEILAKLLELTDGSGEEPEEPTGIIETIIAKEIPMYSVDNAGALAETPFKLIDGTAAPVESGFYTKTDDQGNIIEAGYQDLQVENDEVYYVIALPKEVDYNTMVEVESYDPDEKIWVDADIALTSDPDVVSVLCEEAGIDITHIDTDKYTVWVQEDICTGSIIRYRIIEEN